MNRAWRVPILLLLPVLLVSAVVVQNRTTATSNSNVRLNGMVPAASPEGALSSTWYCAAGSATGVTAGDTAGFAEQSIVVSNATSVDSTGAVSVFTEKGDTTVKAVKVDLALRAVATAQNIEVTDEDLEAEYEAIGVRVNEKTAKVRKAYEQNDAVTDLIAQMRKSQALEWLLHNISYVDQNGAELDTDTVLGDHDHDHDHDHDDAEDAE